MGSTAVRKSNPVNMLDGSLTKNILRFVIPLALTGILQQLFNAADVAVVGQFVGANAMAAVGSNSPVVGLIVNLFVGLSLGSNVVISQLTGMKEWDSIHRVVDISLILALVCGTGAAVVGELLAPFILTMMNVPPEIFSMALAYLRIYLLGLPVILLYNFESAIFRSQGNSVTPLICLAVSGVINVILNLVFVLVCGMTAEGVALATIIANFISSAILFWILTHSNTPVSIRKHKFVLDMALLKKIVFIGLPAGIQSAMFSVANICVQSAINSLGATIMAASSAAFNIEILMYYIVNAFGQACTTFTGQNNGAGNHKRCRAVFRRCMLLGWVFAIVLSAAILAAGTPLLSLFNTEELVLRYGMIRLMFILIPEPINVIMEIISGALRGYGCSTVPALVAVFGICGVRILWVYTAFSLKPTFPTLLICYPLSWSVTALILIFAYLLFMRKRVKSGIETA